MRLNVLDAVRVGDGDVGGLEWIGGQFQWVPHVIAALLGPDADLDAYDAATLFQKVGAPLFVLSVTVLDFDFVVIEYVERVWFGKVLL